jgi:hypothetical protein
MSEKPVSPLTNQQILEQYCEKEGCIFVRRSNNTLECSNKNANPQNVIQNGCDSAAKRFHSLSLAVSGVLTKNEEVPYQVFRTTQKPYDASDSVFRI